MTTMCSIFASPARSPAGGTAQPPTTMATSAASTVQRFIAPLSNDGFTASCSLDQHDVGAHGPCAFVTRNDVDGRACCPADDPLELEPIVGDVVIRPER